jgi:hypothetical protein
MNDDQTKPIPTSGHLSEDGAHELATSPDMLPYLQLIMAEMQGKDTTPQLKTIAELLLEKRYVCRVAPAMKWAFTNFENLNVVAGPTDAPPEGLGQAGRSPESPAPSILHVPGCPFRRGAHGKSDLRVSSACQNPSRKSAREPRTGTGAQR